MSKSLLLSLAVCLLASQQPQQVQGHAYLTKPVSREKGASEDPNGSVGCPNKGPGQVTDFKPGETIDVRYWRNNHIGGFIRWAIVPRGEESKDNFDKNVFYYTCRESGTTCRPKGENGVFSGDNSDDDSISCGDTVALPDWLPAGDYVMQWTWMSVGSSYGHKGWANAQYRSCADIRLSSAGTGTQPKCPAFVGGDRVGELKGEKQDVCFYYYTNDIADDVFKGDDATADQYYKFGVPKQIETCGGGASGGGGGGAVNGTTITTTKAPVIGTKTTKPTKAQGGDDDDTPGVVKPAGGKGEWEFCSEHSECENSCCSKKYSDDGKMKCTPGGC